MSNFIMIMILVCGFVLGFVGREVVVSLSKMYEERRQRKEMSIYRRIKAMEDLKVRKS